MKLKSNDFNDYYFLPRNCGYRLGNKPPSLIISEVPATAISLALVVYDPDVGYGEMTSWIVWNLPINITELSADNLPPSAMQGTNDLGTVGYAGPAPTSGIHHINFLLFALNAQPELVAGANREAFDWAVQNSYMENARLIGMYAAE
jgi:hypothetical protein